MFLVRLWSEYLSKTIPVASIVSGPLIFFQMMSGLPPLVSLYRAVRRENPAERVLLCLTPWIFIVTAAVIQPLFFGSFLGEGFPWTDELRQFLAQPAFFQDILLLAGAFSLVLAAEQLLNRAQGQSSWGVFFRSAGLELPLAAALSAAALDFLLGQGRLFWQLGDQGLKWLVYGVYLLLYQDCALLVCLVWRLFFSEWRQTADDETWLRRYLARGYRAYGWGLLMFSGLWAFAVVGGLRREGSPYGWAAAINLLIAALGLVSLLKSLYQPNYQRILSWGDPEQTFRQIRWEIEQAPPLAKADIGFLTEHYLVLRCPKAVFSRRLLDEQSSRCRASVWTLRFQDGGKCRVNGVYRQLLDPLLGEEFRR